MAVGGSSSDILHGSIGLGGTGQPKLSKGDLVKYWSESKGRWMNTTVDAVDATGAVKLGVKPKVWIGQDEQNAKVRFGNSADDEPPKSIAASTKPHVVTLLPRSAAEVLAVAAAGQRAIAAAAARPSANGISSKTLCAADFSFSDSARNQTKQKDKMEPDKSKRLFSLFAEWDAARKSPEGLSRTIQASDAMDIEHRSEDSNVSRAQQGSLFRERIQVDHAIQRGRKEKECADSGVCPASMNAKRHRPPGCKDQLQMLEAMLLQQPVRSMRKHVPRMIWLLFYKKIREQTEPLKRNACVTARTKSCENTSIETSRYLDADATILDAENYLRDLCTRVEQQYTERIVGETRPEVSPTSSESSDDRQRARLRCIGQLRTMLADLERYRASYGSSEAHDPRKSRAALRRAEHLYRSALEAYPQIGQAFNQLGLLAAHRRDNFGAIVFWLRALFCTVPFPSSLANLSTWLKGLPSSSTRQHISMESRQNNSRHIWAGGALAPCIATFCRLQERLLAVGSKGRHVATEEIMENLGGDLSEALAEADAELAAVLRAPHAFSADSNWLMDLTLATACSTIYHAHSARPPIVSGGKEDAPMEAIFDRADLSSIAASTAWTWHQIFGRTLAEAAFEHEEASGKFLPSASLFALLSSRLLPALWAESALPLRAKMHQAFLCAGRMSNECKQVEASSEILHWALPEDKVCAGLVTLPLEFQPKPAAAIELNEVSDEEEVVLLGPMRKGNAQGATALRDFVDVTDETMCSRSEILGSLGQLAPTSVQDAVRRARLDRLLGMSSVERDAWQFSSFACGMHNAESIIPIHGVPRAEPETQKRFDAPAVLSLTRREEDQVASWAPTLAETSRLEEQGEDFVDDRYEDRDICDEGAYSGMCSEDEGANAFNDETFGGAADGHFWPTDGDFGGARFFFGASSDGTPMVDLGFLDEVYEDASDRIAYDSALQPPDFSESILSMADIRTKAVGLSELEAHLKVKARADTDGANKGVVADPEELHLGLFCPPPPGFAPKEPPGFRAPPGLVQVSAQDCFVVTTRCTSA